MKNFLYVLLIVGSFLSLFIGVFWNHFFPRTISLDRPVNLISLKNESLILSKNSGVDSIIFSGYSNCYTICAKTLPLLEKIATEHPTEALQVIFLELKKNSPQSGRLVPEQFPTVKWVSVNSEQERQLLSDLGLESYSTDHHSAVVLLHKKRANYLELVENFTESKYNDWSKK